MEKLFKLEITIIQITMVIILLFKNIAEDTQKQFQELVKNLISTLDQ